MDTMKDAQIVGVTKFNIHITCINFNSKLSIVGSDSDCVQCFTCNVLQVINGREYEFSAEIVVKNDRDDVKTVQWECAEDIKCRRYCTIMRDGRITLSPKANIIYTKRSNYVKDILNKD